MGISNQIKRPRFGRHSAASTSRTNLIKLCEQLALSSSQIEDRFWERQLLENLVGCLREGDERTLTALLDHLQSTNSHAYEPVINLIEYAAESLVDCAPQDSDVLLIAIPILAWSRYQVPSGTIPESQMKDLRVHLQAHFLAKETRIGLANFLFSPDQLPQSYAETYQLLQRLAPAALHDKDLRIDPSQQAQTVNFLSDTRYVVAAIAAPSGSALFQWQEDISCRDSAIRTWTEQGGAILRRLLPACAVEFVPPGAFHASIRAADRASRAYSVKAGVAFLQSITNAPAHKLSAVIGAYYDRQLEEYRISLLEANRGDVLHGVVWPILDAEDEIGDSLGQIEACLRENGISDITILDQRLPLEFCDDCGVPLYPNRDGEATHVELPEELNSTSPGHLH